jgi:hypothetical protein
MAWRARTAQPIGVTADGLLSIVVQYYDDTDPTNSTVSTTVAPTTVLWAQAWNLPINATTGQLQAAVVAEGQKARAWVAARDAARASVPVGTNIAIP